MTENSISVIIPTWNRAKTIEAAISSVLQQTLPVHEVLICDDGSSDDTRLRVDAMAVSDPRIIWLPGLRSGLPAVPRNRGIAAASGDWIAFLDSDDVWMPKKLELQLAALEKHKVDAICSNGWRFVPGQDNRSLLLPETNMRLRVNDLLSRNLVVCSSVMLRRRLFQQALGFPETPNLKVAEDYALWLRICVQTDFVYLSQPLMVYLDDAPNSVRATSLDGWSERLSVLGDFSAWLAGRQEVPALLRAHVRCRIGLALVRRPISRLLRLCWHTILSKFQ